MFNDNAFVTELDLHVDWSTTPVYKRCLFLVLDKKSAQYRYYSAAEQFINWYILK